MVTAILSDEVYKEVQTTGVFCATIVNKKTTSDLIKQINQLYPLPSFAHLKRVKAGDNTLFILVADEHTGITQSELEVQDALAGLANFHIVQVPKHKPITRVQYKAANALWPTQFHEDKRLEKALSGTLFTDEEESLMKHYMKLAFEECEPHKVTAGAVIVDPETRHVVAKGYTCSSHPLKHAVMVCIDTVAAGQGGGAWSLSVQTYSTLRDEETSPKRQKLCQQYLCTGYDAYVTVEPCIMCAMALVHSRIKRVFYAATNKLSGGLGTHYKIHVQTGLNHHFEVYKLT